MRLVQKALEEPLRWIATNAGSDRSVVLDKVKNGKGAYGFDAATKEFEDLVIAGLSIPRRCAHRLAECRIGCWPTHRGDDCGKTADRA
jgi:chaperonin GroEL